MKNKYNHAIKKMNSTHRGISFIIIFSFMLIVNIVLFVNYIRLKRDINHKESYYKEHLSEYNILFQEANSQQRTLEETKQLKEKTQINIKRTEDELESFEKENNKLIDSLKDLQITLDALSPEIIKQASLKSALEDASDLYEHTKDSIYQSLTISNSYIIKGYDEIDLLKTYLGSNAKLSLCYSSTIDGISSKSFHKRLLKILEAHFDIVELDYGCKELNDSWCYLNFLKVPNGLLLPCLSENFDCDSDIAAKELFEKLFPGNTIIQIFAQPLIKEGGALHCVTWEYIEKKDVACP